MTSTSLGVFVGLATLDVIHRIQAPPAVNEKITSTDQFVAAGGPAANAAVTFAALGGRAILVTALGDDPVAGLVRADLDRYGVEVIDAAAGTARPVPVSAVSVIESTGDRSVVSLDAVASEVAPPADLDAVIAEADVVLIDGHHPRMARAAAESAAAHGIRAVVDAGRWKPIMAELAPRVSDMVCSADFRMPDTDGSDATAAALVAIGVPTIVTTHGGGPIRWWTGGSSGSVDVPAVTAVDTLGAGDVFHGAYSYFSTRAESGMNERLDRSARVAALRCSVVGPRSWLRDLPSDQTRKR
ncbi:kinase [Rhodococcus sp. BP-149]|uniref:PfkB family carbohydrate kinase n=1 Tax=unclassified Rhodococcus (in: high G+C Gram-positive bacteria) TaxID=192944 RepID=UPI001C9AF4E8|nr:MULTISPECIES: PfkB family carbohydrate kinase [unclassified Rhodococcus (in: high G+C Gram-positive bacteria)]MBY6687191.1 kinase [Rhodococcus sp. BP-288]MBY6694386.1 kinase [Rhodococcus sp. BP-188]MBY6698095.1 kinase [Rhodococcus sp. BP-285]MBY6704315.1 kinase [Rhodococcus sp. BP-283]MBY6712964.1 kinase [Rhodococcus sp. BP-160]